MSNHEPELWIARVAAAALVHFDDSMSYLGLAGGKRQGPEWVCLNPRRADNSPGSFSINAMTGEWGDFAIGAIGRDLVSLAAYLWDEKQGEAGRRLAEHFGIAVPARKDGPPRDSNEGGKGKASPAPGKAHQQPELKSAPAGAPASGANSAGEIVMPVPDDAPPIPKAHGKLGMPSRSWEYRDAVGRLLFLVCRFDLAGGGKEIRPLSLRRIPSGKLE